MKKKLLSTTMLLIMLVSLVAGCGSRGGSNKGSESDKEGTGSTPASTEGLDLSKEVNLTMYVVSDRPAGQDVNDEEINKILKEKLNSTLTTIWIPWADYANKYPLLFSSGEEFDMAYAATWLNFTSLAQKGAFMNLDELWPTYAPKNYAATSDNAKMQATVDGHYYAIPTLLATYSAYGPIYRTDIMEGTSWNGKMDTFEDIEAYCDLVKANNPELEPIDIYSAGSEWDDIYMWSLGYLASKGASNDFLFFDPTSDEPELFTYFETEEIPAFLEIMSRWNEKGFYPKSALSDTDSTKTQNGKAAVRGHNVDTYSGYATREPSFGFDYSNMVKYTRHLPYTQDAMVISNTSKNPERALALWDLITSDREAFDTFFYGLEGTTYELNDEGQFRVLDMELYSSSAMWSARTSEFNRDGVGAPEGYAVYKQEFEDAIAVDDTAERYSSFAIDTSSIETEYAACLSAHQQYWWPLELGYVDKDQGLVEYEAKMKAAGIDKVRSVIQEQLDAYVAEHIG